MKPNPMAIIVILLGVGLAASAFSADCFEPLSTIGQGKNLSAPLEIKEFTRQEYEMIEKMLKSLHGQWQGTSTDRYCSQSSDADQTVEKYTIKGRATVDHFGNFYFKMDFFSPEHRTTHQKILRFYLKKDRLRIHNDNSAGDVELRRISSRGIEFFYRVRISNRSIKGGLNRAFHVFLNVEEDAFAIKREIFTQGLLSSVHTWQFRRN